MPPLLTSIGTFKQNLSGSAFEALAAATGDSLSIPDFREGSRGFVEQVGKADVGRTTGGDLIAIVTI